MAQRNRIQQEYINRNMSQRADQQGASSRYRQATAIANKYIRNIQRTRSYQNATSTYRIGVSASPEKRGYSSFTYTSLRNALGGVNKNFQSSSGRCLTVAA